MRALLLKKQIPLTVLSLFLLLINSHLLVAQQKSTCMSGDCYNGHGIKVWENGERYEGWFKNGMRHGYGHMQYEEGDAYIGEWSENLRNGHGVQIYSVHKTNRKYVGEWENNTIQGYGTLHLKRGGLKTGYWNKNQFKPIDDMDGCIEGDCENGWGTYIYPDKSLYVGEFKDKKRHGQGTHIYRMGSKYKGEHSEDLRVGFGIYYYAGGNKYEGEWKNNKKFGDGRMFTLGRLEYGGTWENNILLKKIDPSELDINEERIAIDKTPPEIKIISPSTTRGPIIVSKKNQVRVFGTATDESGIKRIRVNGYPAALGEPNGKSRDFEAYLTLGKGQNEFWVEAVDMKDNLVKIDFTIIKEESEGEETASDPMVVNKNDNAPRTALVIGNSTYLESPLRNPVNDAAAIADKLRSFGFEVTLRLNIRQADMKEIMHNFGEQLKKRGGIGVFYYAGHGIQMNGENYLIPVDAKIKKSLDIELEGIKLQRILNEMEAANNQTNLVILDACRDNPYARLRSQSVGLAAVSGAPVGTFIAYATSPGQAASDGDGKHGLYTQELLHALEESQGLGIEDIFKIVRARVSEKSDRQQVTWENSSLIGELILNPKK